MSLEEKNLGSFFPSDYLMTIKIFIFKIKKQSYKQEKTEEFLKSKK